MDSPIKLYHYGNEWRGAVFKVIFPRLLELIQYLGDKPKANLSQVGLVRNLLMMDD